MIYRLALIDRRGADVEAARDAYEETVTSAMAAIAKAEAQLGLARRRWSDAVAMTDNQARRVIENGGPDV